ncbi:hypothetical protein SDC9_115961 [bioreactor metagenome]|uniref:Uncharacterized protein n=1 Tax=bioreactor metagenome TaxID=1076179 RepID=A0A645BUZ7_9ZZZZ
MLAIQASDVIHHEVERAGLVPNPCLVEEGENMGDRLQRSGGKGGDRVGVGGESISVC